MIYEVNTAVWLAGRRLDEVSWESVALPGVEAVWLMGVWERSPAGLAIARNDPGLEAGNRAALPDLRDADVIGSPYCVRDYVVDARFGGRDALAAARAALAELGLKLILDYVPNHVAPDHPWAASRPELLVPGDPSDPVGSVEVGAGWVARGRDPYFPPWPDVVQLNAFAPALREAVGDTLLELAGQCDGLRCDMAMLMCNDIFARTWGGTPPDEEYWPPLIARVKAAYPEFLFIAEAYWDMEWTLQQQGFDYAYDKRLYDRLVSGSAADVRGHLSADAAYQDKLLRFIENHDEPRAASVFGPAQARAAAVVATTLRGARLLHDGQLDGLRTRIPVFLARGPEEPADGDLRAFYERLLPAVAGPREGWALLRRGRLAGQRLGGPARRVLLARPPGRREPVRRARAGARPAALAGARGAVLDADRRPVRRGLRARRRRAGGRGPVRRSRRVRIARPRAGMMPPGRNPRTEECL